MTAPPPPPDGWEKTAPLRIQNPWATPSGGHPTPSGGHPRPSLPAPPPPPRRNRGLLIAGVVAAVGAVVVGVLAWVGSADEDSAPAVDLAYPDAQARLMRTLPPGYARGVCVAAYTDTAAAATVSCGPNSEPLGPASATYSLMNDEAGLRTGLDAFVRATTAVRCPGNILSPGPWRRNATPDQISGTLYCGLQADQPTIAWTTDDQLLLSIIGADGSGPTFDGLYSWWSAHS